MASTHFLDTSGLGYLWNKIKSYVNANKGVGEDVSGQTFTVDETEVTASDGAERFNDYADNIATGYYSHAEGIGTTASGHYSHAEGFDAKASGNYSHAEGSGTTASAARTHAEGSVTTASGANSHVEGSYSVASGQNSHAEGSSSTASGKGSHAEGSTTRAIGNYSHTEGYYTSASGTCAHVEGQQTKASSNYQHVQGQYNIEDTQGIYAHIVGNGTSSARANIHTLDWNGVAWYKGGVKVGGTSAADATELTPGVGENVEGQTFTVDGAEVTAATGAERFNNYGGGTETANVATGKYSHAEGSSTIASNNASHAEGTNTKASGANSHVEGTGTTASGAQSHAEGGGTTASGNNSHAEGGATTASGEVSHAEGGGTTASGPASHAEGGATRATKQNSHAEGGGSLASGIGSHAEGNGTIAASDYQHVQGKFNLEDMNGVFAHIVGGGTSAINRADIHTLDWSGNAWFKGNVRVGGTSYNDATELVVSPPEIFIGSTTPSGYTMWIDPEGSITDGNEVKY